MKTPDLQRENDEYLESTTKLFMAALRSGKDLPNRQKVHRHLTQAARALKGWSEKGSSAWATMQIEDARRAAVARIADDETT